MARSLRRLAPLLLLACLAGCGFTALYGDRGANGAGASQELATVRIASIRNREGQLLHNFLRDRINPLGRPVAPRYILAVNLDELEQGIALARDRTATRVNLTVVATYSLQRTSDGRTVFTASSRSNTGYDVLREQFATEVAAADARTRALRDLSEDIANRVAAFLALGPASPAESPEAPASAAP